MVATRKSIGAAPQPESPTTTPANDNTPVARALKKLAINGSVALKGDKKALEEAKRASEEKLETYHFRGATYLRTPDTNKEWIEKQPERYLKRKSTGEEPASSGAAREESHDHSEDDDEDIELPLAKRTRHSLPNNHGKTRVEMLKEKEKEKPKRRATLPAKKKGKAEPLEAPNNSRIYDMSAVGGADTRVISKALPKWCPPPPEERQVTRRKSQAKAGPSKSELESPRPPLPPTRAPKDVPPPITLNQIRLAAALGKLGGPPIEPGFAEKNFQIACLKLAENTKRKKRLEKEYEKLLALEDRIMAESAAAAFAKGDLDDDPPIQPTPDTKPEKISTTTPPNDVSLSASQQQPTPGSRSTRSPTTTTISSESEGLAFRHLKPTDPLPQFDKGGNRLRWTLDRVVKDTGRAEHHIFVGRLRDESASSKRRRVRRELEIVQRWERLEPEMRVEFDLVHPEMAKGCKGKSREEVEKEARALEGKRRSTGSIGSVSGSNADPIGGGGDGLGRRSWGGMSGMSGSAVTGAERERRRCSALQMDGYVSES